MNPYMFIQFFREKGDPGSRAIILNCGGPVVAVAVTRVPPFVPMCFGEDFLRLFVLLNP